MIEDAVISAVGKNSLKETTLYSTGNKNLLAMMEKTNTKRVFFISAAGLEINPSFNLFVKLTTKFVLQNLLKNMFADLIRMERIVKESKENWTIISSSAIN